MNEAAPDRLLNRAIASEFGVSRLLLRAHRQYNRALAEDRMSSWSCPHQVDDICRKVAGAYCRPGMRGCVIVGKVTFQDGRVPHPVWPPGADPRERARAEADLCAGPGTGGHER